MALEDRYRKALEQGILNLGGTVPPIGSPSNEDERWATLLDALVARLGQSAAAGLPTPSDSPPDLPANGALWLDDSLLLWQYDQTNTRWLSEIQRSQVSFAAINAAVTYPLLENNFYRCALVRWSSSLLYASPSSSSNRYELSLTRLTSPTTTAQITTQPGNSGVARTASSSGLNALPLYTYDFPSIQVNLVSVGSPPAVVYGFSELTYRYALPS